MDETKLRSMLTLMAVPNVGETRLRYLVDTFKTPENVFQTPVEQLTALPNISQNLANDILTFRNPRWVDKQLSQIDKHGVRIISLWDNNYPAQLRTIFDPPPVLFIKGQLLPEDAFAMAIVGTRRATHYGRQMAKTLSTNLSQRGISIISGLARGIDSVAHKSAIIAGGRTIAVLGSGLDVIYPPENRKLFAEIELNGAIISEFPMGTRPEAGNFPGRNRVISGLSLGVLIVEAPEKSGALLTADFALDQGREVFALPGNVTSPMSAGTNHLLKSGAKIVTDVEDIIDELRHLPQSISQRKKLDKKEAPKLSGKESGIYQALSTEPIHIDLLSEQTGLQTSELLGHLLQMELKGAVTQLPGKLFVVG